MLDLRKIFILLVLLLSTGLYSADPPVSEHRRERTQIQLENFDSYSPSRTQQPSTSQQRSQRAPRYKLSWEYYRTEGRDWRTYGERRPAPESRRRHITPLSTQPRIRRSSPPSLSEEQRRLSKLRERTIQRMIARQQAVARRNVRLLQIRRQQQQENSAEIAAVTRRRRPIQRRYQPEDIPMTRESTESQSTRPRPAARPSTHNIKSKMKILYMNLSEFFFKTGTPLIFTAYVSNENPAPSLLEVKVSLFIHKQGKRSMIPERSMTGFLQGGMITPFKFHIIWNESGYSSNYNYHHGDYQFELVVEHGNIKISESRVLYARPINYTFYINKPQ